MSDRKTIKWPVRPVREAIAKQAKWPVRPVRWAIAKNNKVASKASPVGDRNTINLIVRPVR